MVFTLNKVSMVWRSIKQSCITDYTIEIEYITTCEAAKKVVWPYKFLINLKVVPDAAQSMTLYCDNSRVVKNSKEPRSHKHSKHIERIYHSIREIVVRRDVELK